MEEVLEKLSQQFTDYDKEKDLLKEKFGTLSKNEQEKFKTAEKELNLQFNKLTKSLITTRLNKRKEVYDILKIYLSTLNDNERKEN